MASETPTKRDPDDYADFCRPKETAIPGISTRLHPGCLRTEGAGPGRPLPLEPDHVTKLHQRRPQTVYSKQIKIETCAFDF